MIKQRSGTRASGECVTQSDVFTTFWRFPWSITEQTNSNMKSICSSQWEEKTTYLPLTAWLAVPGFQFRSVEAFFKPRTLLFISASLVSSLSYLYRVSPKSYSTSSLAQSKKFTKNIFRKLRVSRSDDIRWQLLWRFPPVYAFCHNLVNEERIYLLTVQLSPKSGKHLLSFTTINISSREKVALLSNSYYQLIL